MNGDGGVGCGKNLRGIVVHRGVTAVEEARLRQQEKSLTGRAQDRALLVHLPDPVDDFRVPARLPSVGSEIDGRHDQDVTRIDRLDRPLHFDRDAARQRQRLLLLTNDLDVKRGGPGGSQALSLDVSQHVVDAKQGRCSAVGHGHDADVARRRSGRRSAGH